MSHHQRNPLRMLASIVAGSMLVTGIVCLSWQDSQSALHAQTAGSSRPPMCGNGIVEPGEGCDDGVGNGTNGDQCAANCTLLPGGSCTANTQCEGNLCSNGVCDCVQGRPCFGGPRCNMRMHQCVECLQDSDCAAKGFPLCDTSTDTCVYADQSLCGNGKPDPGEECDYGFGQNGMPGVGYCCTTRCKMESRCFPPALGCPFTNLCNNWEDKTGMPPFVGIPAKRDTCGNGMQDANEQCDHGGSNGMLGGGDGCNADCTINAKGGWTVPNQIGSFDYEYKPGSNDPYGTPRFTQATRGGFTGGIGGAGIQGSTNLGGIGISNLGQIAGNAGGIIGGLFGGGNTGVGGMISGQTGNAGGTIGSIGGISGGTDSGNGQIGSTGVATNAGNIGASGTVGGTFGGANGAGGNNGGSTTGGNTGGAPSCSPQDCGPPLGMPNFFCADGTVAGPTGICERKPDGHCGWQVRQCNDCGDGICESYETGLLVPGHIGPPYYCPQDCPGRGTTGTTGAGGTRGGGIGGSTAQGTNGNAAGGTTGGGLTGGIGSPSVGNTGTQAGGAGIRTPGQTTGHGNGQIAASNSANRTNGTQNAGTTAHTPDRLPAAVPSAQNTFQPATAPNPSFKSMPQQETTVAGTATPPAAPTEFTGTREGAASAVVSSMGNQIVSAAKATVSAVIEAGTVAVQTAENLASTVLSWLSSIGH